MTAMPAIDVHVHHVPQSLVDECATGFHPASVRVDGGLVRVGSPGQERPFPHALVSIDELKKWMDAAGLAEAVVSGWSELFFHHLPAKQSEGWHVLMNDHLFEALSGEERLMVCPSLPLSHAEASVRLVENYGERSFGFTAGITGIDFSDPGLDIVWQHLAALGKPLLIHPEHGCAVVTPNLPEMANLWARTAGTTRALTELTLSGVFARHPGLMIIAVHGGGGFAQLIGRLQNTIDLRKRDAEYVAAALRGIWVDSLTHDSRLLSLLTSVHGEDRVVLGSDFPFPVMDADPVRSVISGTADQHFRQLILSGNAQAIRAQSTNP